MKSKQRVKLPNNGCFPKYIADFINQKVIRLQIGLSIESFTSNLVRSFRDNPKSFRKNRIISTEGFSDSKLLFQKKLGQNRLCRENCYHWLF